MLRVAVMFGFCGLVAALFGFTPVAGEPLVLARIDAVVFAALGSFFLAVESIRSWRARRFAD